MKVKILSESPFDPYQPNKYPSLEEQINDFIKDKQIIDIKYQASCSGFADGEIHGTDYDASCLIMYEEGN